MTFIPGRADDEMYYPEPPESEDENSSNMCDLKEFDQLTITERNAFIAWFAGGNCYVTEYQSRPNQVFFGKAECEWVPFREFWLNKLPSLGWVRVEEEERFIAVGMIGQPEAIKYHIFVTNKGLDVRKSYWDRLNNKICR